MKRSILVAATFLWLTACVQPPALIKPREAAVETTSGEILQVRFALSLKQLQREAGRSLEKSNALAAEFAGLGRLTRIAAVFFEHDDILLAGVREEGVPPLDLDHFVVALRNAFAVGKEYEGIIGCTIDPRPGNDPWTVQDARVFGGPHRSAMSALHVGIDYQLKLVGAGFSSMPGVIGSFDRNSGPVCGQNSGAYQATHRFWFTSRYPPSPRFVEDAGAVWVQRPILVQLMTEEEFLNAGKRVGATNARPEAQEFARQVTSVLEGNDVELAARLRQSFRVIEIAKLIRRHTGSEAILRFLLHEYALLEPPVPTEVKGVIRSESTSVVCSTETIPMPNGVHTIEHRMSARREYRGGVEARIDLTKDQFRRDSKGLLAALHRRIVSSRPLPDDVLWSVR